MNKLVKTNTKLKTGDEVVVITGKDIGKKGNIRKIMKSNNLSLIHISSPRDRSLSRMPSSA